MLDRRSFLASSAALAACASTPLADPANDASFRALVDRLADASPIERRDALEGVNPETLTFDGRLLYEAIIAGARADAKLEALPYGDGGRPYAVTHRSGAYRRIPAELGRDDEALARAIDADTTKLEASAAIGAAPPDFIIDRTLAAIGVARRPLMLARGPGAAAVGAAVTRQTETLEGLRESANEDAGVWRLPDGETFYMDAQTLALGSSFEPRDAHALAQERCAHFSVEAFRLLQEGGYDPPAHRTTLGALLARAAADPAHLYSDDDAGKTRAVSAMNATLAQIRTLLPQAFSAGLLRTPAEIRRMSAEDEAGGAAGRRDGGAYIVDLTRVRTRPAWTLPSVVAHETLPGHGLQAPLQQTAAPPALQLRYASGYSEGWAIYAETLIDELGLYDGKPLDRLGYVHWMLFRWGRVLVDTGVNVMRWSRTQALAQRQALQGFDVAFATMADEVDRVCVEPGVFAAQGIAAFAIEGERDDARSRFGAAFDLKRFHDAALRHGPLPPDAMRYAGRHAFGG